MSIIWLQVTLADDNGGNRWQGGEKSLQLWPVTWQWHTTRRVWHTPVCRRHVTRCVISQNRTDRLRRPTSGSQVASPVDNIESTAGRHRRSWHLFLCPLVFPICLIILISFCIVYYWYLVIFILNNLLSSLPIYFFEAIMFTCLIIY